MKTASTQLINSLKREVALKSSVRLYGEWNYNRYAGIQTVDTTAGEAATGYDLINYPISSIVEPIRPEKRGIIKARATKASGTSAFLMTQQSYYSIHPTTAEGTAQSGYEVNPTGNRYYTAGPNAPYKYWTSSVPSGTTYNGTNGYNFSTSQQPYVVYTNNANTNKIIIGLENTVASPINYTVDITTNGTTWSTIATNPAIDSAGRIVLYRQAGGTWSATQYLDNPTNIRGVRLTVGGMALQNTFLNVIEISARLMLDLSQYVVNYGTEFTMDEPNFITPIGKMSSNTASVELSNIDGFFNDDNASSTLYGLVKPNVAMWLDVGIDTTPQGGSGTEWTREFTMFVDTWGGHDTESAQVELKDFSKYMQEIKVPAMLWQNATVSKIIWMICDVIGFTGYVVDTNTATLGSTIPYFWTDGEKTAWAAIQELAEATQTAVFFDEYGTLRIQNREYALSSSRASSWDFNAVDALPARADIVDVDSPYTYDANDVTITYQEIKTSDNNKGFPQMETVWQPEDTLTLRSSALYGTMTNAQTSFQINPSDAAFWPYTGKVNIEGEVIAYNGKQYSYYAPSATTKTLKTIYTDDEKKQIDTVLSDPTKAFMNSFTGWLAITKRGSDNTTATSHSTTLDPTYTARYNTVANGLGLVSSKFALSLNRPESSMHIQTNSTIPLTSRYAVLKDQGATPTYFGARMKFPTTGYPYGVAGLVHSGGSNDSGYYLEFCRSQFLNTWTTQRQIQNEVSMYVRNSTGTITRFGGKGTPVLIPTGVWFDVDVKFEVNGATHTFTVSVNGVAVGIFSISAGRLTPTSVMGAFVRGFSGVDIDYMYSFSGTLNPTLPDTSTVLDLIKGGFSSVWPRTLLYNWTNTQYGSFMDAKSVSGVRIQPPIKFDDFGPMVHEIRDFDVKFSKTPVLHSKIYLTNDYQAFCTTYRPTPFGAKFTLINSSRNNAILQGDDSLTFGPDNIVNQQTLIYGRTIYQDSEKTVNVKDASSIRARGTVSTEINNMWIQTTAEATRLGNWITSVWSQGMDEVTATVYGNPLVQVGDVVTLNYPAKNMTTATHAYFVVGKKDDYDTGLGTQLTLRRKKF